jgi:hypothetical protein
MATRFGIITTIADRLLGGYGEDAWVLPYAFIEELKVAGLYQ